MKIYHVKMLVIVFMLGCSSSRIEKSYKDPEVVVEINKLKKILVIAHIKDEITRRIAEDKLVSKLAGKGVPSYVYFKNLKIGEDLLKERFKDDSYDGTVLLSLVRVEKEARYVATYPHII